MFIYAYNKHLHQTFAAVKNDAAETGALVARLRTSQNNLNLNAASRRRLDMG
jgi:hypothetical protein